MRFNADEVFEMAGQIELNGMRFYRKAAEAMKDETCKKMLLDLAEMEQQHKDIFDDMRKGLSAAMKTPTVFDPDDESVMYVRAFADGTVFDIKADPAAALTGDETIDQILTRAIELEKDSIAFYLGLEDMIPPKLGQSKIKDIIREEMGHVTMLGARRKTLMR